MKKLALFLVVLLTAASLFAGEGKGCDMHKSSAKTVELNGTIVTNADGAHLFKVANSDKSYTICHMTAENVLKLGESGATLAVKGKLVSCDESHGQELVIETAKKI